ncbi:MAG TPA: S8/S53 family peptidase [Ignavibacteriaceae bacterium]|nr:S8/S53 family peptidase [Ignavibacteriaceae bacterium]
MKKLVLSCILFISVLVFPQSPLSKTTDELNYVLGIKSSNDMVLVWIQFTDKGDNLEKFYANPKSVVSDYSIKRRLKVLDKPIDFDDLPVNMEYVKQLEEVGFQVKQKSKWFNSISGYITKENLQRALELGFVAKSDIVYTLKKDYKREASLPKEDIKPVELSKNLSLDYGTSYTQNFQMNVPALHNAGLNGTGVRICVMDAGFSNLPHPVFSQMNIIAKWDFVNNDPNVGDGTDMGEGSHGTETLSCLGGYKPGSLIGPAYGATFILAKTENTDSETPIEEDNWIAALEWADSIGVDLTSTSLGYIDFDPPFTSYTWQSMNGNTCRITIAADLAVKKGIAVFNSAGNEYDNTTHNTLGAPADGDSVISIGAVTSTGTRVSFSSVGPTVDGRIKPDLMAMGSSVVVANPYLGSTTFTTSSGTSFSCPLAAGAAALLLQANPNLTPIQLRDAMRNTASRHNTPDKYYGWGIINVLDAYTLIVPVELTSFTASASDEKVVLNWSTATENNNNGFEIQRRKAGSTSYETRGFVKGNGTTSEKSNYSFQDKIEQEGKFYYRLKQLDFSGEYEYSQEVMVDLKKNYSFEVFQNYPNPFNPSTNIKFTLPEQMHIKMSLFNIIGKEIKTLVDDNMERGAHTYTLNAGDLSTGVYFVKISGGSFTKTIKINLIK